MSKIDLLKYDWFSNFIKTFVQYVHTYISLTLGICVSVICRNSHKKDLSIRESETFLCGFLAEIELFS